MAATPTKSPCFVAGTNRASGDVGTGELQTVRGGGRCACVLSGSLLVTPNVGGPPGITSSGGHILFFSGAGRLNSVLPQVTMSGGLAVYFYDAATLAPSGTSVSGQKIIGVIPAFTMVALSGAGAQVPFTGQPFNVDMPFTSGLCAAIPSGTPGFTVSWTPEAAPTYPNP